MYESDAFPSIIAHKLQTPPNITIGHWNVNSLRNEIKAVEELIKKNIDVCLLTETKID